MADLAALQSSVCPPARSRRMDLGLLTLRLTAGSLLAAHGAQKLFGAFHGPGLQGVGGWLESIGFRPGKQWAVLAGLSEFGGGTLTALGLGGPIGPLTIQGSMAIASRTAHWKLPVWAAEGGAEVPILYSSTGLALALTGPGRYSLDRAFHIEVPRSAAALTVAGVAGGIYLANRIYTAAQEQALADVNAGVDAAQAGEDRPIAPPPTSETAPQTPPWTEPIPPPPDQPEAGATAG
jgi:putative oxidoreductase